MRTEALSIRGDGQTWEELTGLVALWDMYRLSSTRYTVACFALESLKMVAMDIDDSAEARRSAIEKLSYLRKECQAVGIDCLDLIDRVKEAFSEGIQYDHARGLIIELQHALFKDFKGRACFLLSREETTLLQTNLSSDALSAFPGSNLEIKRSGQCIALGQYRAGVYHAMNALELPLKAMAKYFNVPFDDQTTWGTAIGNIKDKIDKIERSKKLNKRRANDALAFYGEAAKEFSYFKDAWRNHVMHLRGEYDAHTARSVHDHTKAFIDHLSKRLSIRSRKRYWP